MANGNDRVQRENKNTGRSGIGIMFALLGMIKPLQGMMVLAVIMGCAGNLMAVFLTVLGGAGLGRVLGFFPGLRLDILFAVIIAFALLRGILRYLEQASNHYIAFKLLAQIRHQVFAALRRLAPTKLDGSEKGNLVSIITSDIELLEVFYAHTISPVIIGILTSLFMSLFIGGFHWGAGFMAALCYFCVGVGIPIVNSLAGQKYGREYRRLYGSLNNMVLDNLYGLDEILQFGQEQQRMDKMKACTEQTLQADSAMKKQEACQKLTTDSIILAAGSAMTVLCGALAARGSISPGEAIICIISMMSSFGSVAALSVLSNNLNHTLASGNRVLDILSEKPVVTDINSPISIEGGNIHMSKVSFSYDKFSQNSSAAHSRILHQFTEEFRENTIHGILGRSGCGKSTLLKLLMRFYETEKGSIHYGSQNINDIDTGALRDYSAYVTQETFLFQDTIENNIKIADGQASREEVMEAAKKAAIHDFIASLPGGYDTRISELGESVSGGERQRIGLARAFLHKARLILLDEPTSNIDSLNEGIILKSLKEEKQDRTIILVSHRASTMSIADKVTSIPS